MKNGTSAHMLCVEDIRVLAMARMPYSTAQHTCGQHTQFLLHCRVAWRFHGGGTRGEPTHLSFSFVTRPLTTHPLPDGAPFQLLARPSRLFHTSHQNLYISQTRPCFAVCDRHSSPSIAIVFSAPSIVPNYFMPPTFNSRILYGGEDVP